MKIVGALVAMVLVFYTMSVSGDTWAEECGEDVSKWSTNESPLYGSIPEHCPKYQTFSEKIHAGHVMRPSGSSDPETFKTYCHGHGGALVYLDLSQYLANPSDSIRRSWKYPTGCHFCDWQSCRVWIRDAPFDGLDWKIQP